MDMFLGFACEPCEQGSRVVPSVADGGMRKAHSQPALLAATNPIATAARPPSALNLAPPPNTHPSPRARTGRTFSTP